MKLADEIMLGNYEAICGLLATYAGEGLEPGRTLSTPLYTAVLGGEVRVPTPKGTFLALKVPPETPNGQRMRLAGQGMPRVGGGRGDLYAEITVELPRKLTQREKELFSELAGLRSAAAQEAH